jgi:uncharacterized NAD-dependent epimerase/dehydratase family protein
MVTGRGIGGGWSDAMDGTALVICDGYFDTPVGKTAHGLVRGTDRYRVVGVIDGVHAGRDAGEVLGGRAVGIPVYRDLGEALANLPERPDYLVLGMATDGGVLPPEVRPVLVEALGLGIHVDSGLHQPLGQDPELLAAATAGGAAIRDIRRSRPIAELHFFEGKIEEVGALRIAVLGTDSAIGKRTTARLLMESLRARGVSTEMIGTGQTAWFQGIRYCMFLDATVNDFVAGEIEHTVHQAWVERRPQVILLEGQGCLTNPAFPGGFELLAAGRPHGIVLQHAPRRRCYDGFPGYPLAGVEREKAIIELLSQRPVVAITLNHEEMTREEVDAAVDEYQERYGVAVADPLLHGVDAIVAALESRFPEAFS